MVCDKDYEPRQPQDFVRGVVDQQAVPWSRREASDTFVGVCDQQSRTAIPRRAKPGCVQPNDVMISYDSTWAYED